MTTENQTLAKPLPCPFCGSTEGLNFDDGSTYRWGIASCIGCGATAGEVRRSYSGGDAWHADAIKEWNIRAAIPAPEGESPAELVCAQAYQVVGSLLDDLGQFGTALADKILDNLSEARIVHDDVLPWPSFAAPAEGDQRTAILDVLAMIDEDGSVINTRKLAAAALRLRAALDHPQPKGTAEAVAEVRATGSNSCGLFFLPAGVDLKPGDKLYAGPAQAPAPGADTSKIAAYLRWIMRTVNNFEAKTGKGGWFAEEMQDACNAIAKETGTPVKFGISNYSTDYEHPTGDNPFPSSAVVDGPVGHVTSFSDLGCTCDYVSPQKYRPPVGAPLYVAPPDHTAVMRQALEALLMVRNHSSVSSHQIEILDVPIASLRDQLGGESKLPVQDKENGNG